MRRLCDELCVGQSAEASTDHRAAAVLFLRWGLPEHGHLLGLMEKTSRLTFVFLEGLRAWKPQEHDQSRPSPLGY